MRYLVETPVPGKHTIWIGYDRAKIESVIEIDDVTFYPPALAP